MAVIAVAPSGAIKQGGAAPGATDAAQVVGLSPAGNTVSLGDIAAVLHALLAAIANPISADVATGRQRVSVDNIAAAATLASVTTIGTVSSVTNVAAIGNFNANDLYFAAMATQWADSIRGRIT